MSNVRIMSMNTSTFWSLSLHACLPVMRKVVRALLWVMRCPKGLIGQSKINPER